jgi:molybdopterin-guanine dinucleotide biosynthesis protein A
MSAHQEIVGVVIAGGNSVRMGTDKALLLFNGKPLIARVAAVLLQCFERVMVIADRVERYSFLNLPVYPDLFKGCGPLGGIHAAMSHSPVERLFVSACDTPFISQALIEHIIRYPSEMPIKVAEMDGEVQPLCGLYSRSALPSIQQALESNILQVKRVLQEVGAAKIPITPELPFYHPLLLKNFNTPADVEQSAKLFEAANS